MRDAGTDFIHWLQLREMHAVLMAGGRGDKMPGEFRRSQNGIGGTRPGNAHFVPPPPQEVEACMAVLEVFLHNDTDSLSILLRAAPMRRNDIVPYRSLRRVIDIGYCSLIPFLLSWEAIIGT